MLVDGAPFPARANQKIKPARERLLGL